MGICRGSRSSIGAIQGIQGIHRDHVRVIGTYRGLQGIYRVCRVYRAVLTPFSPPFPYRLEPGAGGGAEAAAVGAAPPR